MKNQIFLITALIFLLTGCNSQAVDELKAENNYLKLENTTLNTRLDIANTSLSECITRQKKTLFKYDESKINLNDDEGISARK